MVDPAFITPFGEKPDFAQRATWADRGAEPMGSQKKPGWFRVRLSKRECKPNPKIRASCEGSGGTFRPDFWIGFSLGFGKSKRKPPRLLLRSPWLHTRIAP